MKKLMIASAIAVAAFALKADITSANVVGYQEIETASSGNVLITPTFLNVSESNEVSLADLKVTGYDAPYWDASGKKGQNKGGCTGGKFVIQTLTTQGLADEKYAWLDYTTSATTKKGPGWFNADGTEISGGEASVKLDAGKALWITGSGYSLQPTGAVNPFDVSYQTASVGNVAVGNCMPANTKLSDLTVTGYDAPYWDASGKKGQNKGGCTGGKFVIQTLTTQGLADEKYAWLDYTMSATTKKGPGWFNADGTEISGGADNVVLDPGKGLWVTGSGYNLIVPAVELGN